MSDEMKAKFISLLDLYVSDIPTELVKFIGNGNDAQAWYQIIHYIAKYTIENAECPESSVLLQDEMDDNIIPSLIHAIKLTGFDFSREITFSFTDEDALDDLISESYVNDNYSSIGFITKVFDVLTDIECFYRAYIRDIVEHYNEQYETDNYTLENDMLVYAAFKMIESQLVDAKKFGEEDAEKQLLLIFPLYAENRSNLRIKALDEIIDLKEYAVEFNLPLKWELMDYVSASHGILSSIAEKEYYGFNKARLHPDVYMNEILQTQRVNTQAIALILDKLGIDKSLIDTSNISLKI